MPNLVIETWFNSRLTKSIAQVPALQFVYLGLSRFQGMVDANIKAKLAISLHQQHIFSKNNLAFCNTCLIFFTIEPLIKTFIICK